MPSVTVLTECAEGDTFCITDATWTDLANPRGILDIAGFSPYVATPITIVNGVTEDVVFNIRSKVDGTFETTVTRLRAGRSTSPAPSRPWWVPMRVTSWRLPDAPAELRW